MEITAHPRNRTVTVTMSALEAILVRDALEIIDPVETQLRNLGPEAMALNLSDAIDRILPG